MRVTFLSMKTRTLKSWRTGLRVNLYDARVPKLWPKIFFLSLVCHHGAGEDSVDKAEYEPDKMKFNQDDRTGNFHNLRKKNKGIGWLFPWKA